MGVLKFAGCAVIALMIVVVDGAAQQVRGAEVVQGRLTAPGSAPFHLKASIDGGRGEVEMEWLSPDHWRRTIQSPEFVQTIVVDGDRMYEHDSPQYFPLDLRSLVMAMVEPERIEEAVRPGDMVQTKANGLASESGIVCYDEQHRMCGRRSAGLMETLGAAGHTVSFMNYQTFHGKRIARRLMYSISAGDSTMAEVTKLEDLKHPQSSLFEVKEATPADQQLHVVTLPEIELSALEEGTQEIIWPQVLDGAQTGQGSFYVSLDTTGKVREVHPLSIGCERANDTVVRQLLRWKFKRAEKDGRGVQAEGVLTFHFDTRAWGPKETLSDAEARKLATNMVAPQIPAGKYPPGTEYKLWIAVDSDGVVIEKIVASGPGDLFGEIDAALKQWRFKPVLEGGQPRPYRALLVFPIS